MKKEYLKPIVLIRPGGPSVVPVAVAAGAPAAVSMAAAVATLAGAVAMGLGTKLGNALFGDDIIKTQNRRLEPVS